MGLRSPFPAALGSLLAAAARFLLALLGAGTPHPAGAAPGRSGEGRLSPGESPAQPVPAMVPFPRTDAGPAAGSPAVPAAHALRLDAASVLVISEPPAPEGRGEQARRNMAEGPAGGVNPPPNPVTVVVLPRPDAARPLDRLPGGNGGTRGPERALARPLGPEALPGPPSGFRGSASPWPRPWWRPAGLPGAPSDGLRGSWDGGREPWFTGRWAR